MLKEKECKFVLDDIKDKLSWQHIRTINGDTRDNAYAAEIQTGYFYTNSNNQDKSNFLKKKLLFWKKNEDFQKKKNKKIIFDIIRKKIDNKQGKL